MRKHVSTYVDTNLKMFYDRFTAAFQILMYRSHLWLLFPGSQVLEVLDPCGLLMTQIHPLGYFYFNSSKNTARARIALGS